MLRQHNSHPIEKRITWVLFFFFSITAILVGRLFIVQIVAHEEYLQNADKQQGVRGEISTPRGSILAVDSKGAEIPLASNRKYKNLIVAPNRVKNPDEVVRVLSEEFSIPSEEILARIGKKDDPYEILAKKLSPSEEAEERVRKLDGVFFEDDVKRVYPHDSLGSRFIGFVAGGEERDEGKYGLERAYDARLDGEEGFFTGVQDAKGFFLALGRKIARPGKAGSDIVLTVDYNIQVKAREVLEKSKEKWSAPSGIVIVVEPSTGRILAMDALPAYNLNEFNKEKDLSVFQNPAVESVYELGSVMKTVTMAAGVEEKKVTPEATYTDYGAVKVLDREIKNFDGKARGVQTMSQVLEKSLNTGAVYVARLLGREKQKEYFENFGFGEKSGIDLPGELAGNMTNIEKGYDVEYATASFGQGIAVTPLQMAMAVGAIANNGKLMRPYIVEEVRDKEGNVTMKNEPQVRRSVISPETSQTLTKMLVSVVRNGFEKRASVKGYFIAGKTGTAQVPRRDGKGYSEESIHTLIGYAPAFEPKFLIYIQLNEPKGNRFAANTLTPAFYDLAEYMLNYYEVPPDEPR